MPVPIVLAVATDAAWLYSNPVKEARLRTGVPVKGRVAADRRPAALRAQVVFDRCRAGDPTGPGVANMPARFGNRFSKNFGWSQPRALVWCTGKRAAAPVSRHRAAGSVRRPLQSGLAERKSYFSNPFAAPSWLLCVQHSVRHGPPSAGLSMPLRFRLSRPHHGLPVRRRRA